VSEIIARFWHVILRISGYFSLSINTNTQYGMKLTIFRWQHDFVRSTRNGRRRFIVPEKWTAWSFMEVWTVSHGLPTARSLCNTFVLRHEERVKTKVKSGGWESEERSDYKVY